MRLLPMVEMLQRASFIPRKFPIWAWPQKETGNFASQHSKYSFCPVGAPWGLLPGTFAHGQQMERGAEEKIGGS